MGWGEINTLGGRQFTPSVGVNPHPWWGEIHTLGGGKSTPSVGGNPHPRWGEIHTLGGGQSKLNYKKRTCWLAHAMPGNLRHHYLLLLKATFSGIENGKEKENAYWCQTERRATVSTPLLLSLLCGAKNSTINKATSPFSRYLPLWDLELKCVKVCTVAERPFWPFWVSQRSLFYPFWAYEMKKQTWSHGHSGLICE